MAIYRKSGRTARKSGRVHRTSGRMRRTGGARTSKYTTTALPLGLPTFLDFPGRPFGEHPLKIRISVHGLESMNPHPCKENPQSNSISCRTWRLQRGRPLSSPPLSGLLSSLSTGRAFCHPSRALSRVRATVLRDYFRDCAISR